MRLELFRFYFGDKSTIGALFANGVFECFTLELPRLHDGKPNVPDLTCIPARVYDVRVMPSPKHPLGTPHIINVPGRSAVEMHVANKPSELKGCVAVGQVASVASNEVLASGAAFDHLMEKLKGREDVKIEIRELLPDSDAPEYVVIA